MLRSPSAEETATRLATGHLSRWITPGATGGSGHFAHPEPAGSLQGSRSVSSEYSSINQSD
nr:MAG TPA: hypothetical protein [Caudoviricetes sp.]